MTEDARPPESADPKRAEKLARFDEEIRKALRSAERGEVVDADTAFAHLEAEIAKHRQKRAA